MSILVPLDFSESDHLIIDHAQQLAKGLNLKLWLLHVADPEPDFIGYKAGPQPVRDSVAQHYHKERQQLQEIAENIRSADIDCTALMVQGATIPTILAEAEKLVANLIIIGSHHQRLVNRLLFGSTAEAIMKRAKIPVLVVPTE